MSEASSKSTATQEHVYREVYLNIPGRQPTAPAIFEAFNHPLAPRTSTGGAREGRTLVIFLDTSLDEMKKAFRIENECKVDYGDVNGLVREGWFELNESDSVFTALKCFNWDLRRPGTDVIRAIASGNEHLSAGLRARVQHVRHQMHGDIRERGNEIPTYNNITDSYDGGCFIERSQRMAQSKRTYTLGPSIEKQRKIYAPVASCKLTNANMQLDDNVRLRAELLQVTTEVATAGLRDIPIKIWDCMSRQSDVLNALRLGNDKRSNYSTMQLNLSAAKEHNAGGIMTELGTSGTSHYDKYDDVLSLTSHTACSDVPDDYEPGNMFLLLIQCFTRLDLNRSLKFSGFNKHAGSSAKAPPHQSVPLSANRGAFVHYRQKYVAEGSAIIPIAAKADNSDAIYTTPEMRFPERPEYSEKRGQITRSTYARDGLSMSCPSNLITFMARELYCLAGFILRQLPDRMKVQFDSDLFMQSISYVGDDGTRRTVSPWNYPPGWRKDGACRDEHQEGAEVDDLVDQIPYREHALARERDTRTCIQRTMPYSMVHGHVQPFTDQEVDRIIGQYDAQPPAFPGDYRKMSLSSVTQKFDNIFIKEHDDVNARNEEGTSDSELVTPSEAAQAKEDVKRKNEEMGKKARDAFKKAEAAYQRKKKALAKVNSLTHNATSSEAASPNDSLSTRKLLPESEDNMFVSPSINGNGKRSMGACDESEMPSIDHSIEPQGRGHRKRRKAGGDSDAKSFEGDMETEGNELIPTTQHDGDGLNASESIPEISFNGADYRTRTFPLETSANNDAVSMELRNGQLNHEVKHKIRDFNILKLYSLQNLQTEVRVIEHDIVNDGPIGEVDIILPFNELNYNCGLLNSPANTGLEDSFQVVNKLMDNISALDVTQAFASLLSHRMRGMTMITYLGIAKWLHAMEILAEEVYGIGAEHVSPNKRWIWRLTADARTCVTLGSSNKTFKQETYLQDSQMRTSLISRRGTHIVDDIAIFKATVDIVLRVLEDWTCIESKIPAWKLYLLQLVEEAFGVQCLALDSTWKLLISATPHKVCDNKAFKKRISRMDLTLFRDALNRHPLANPDSCESFNAVVLYNYKSRGWALDSYTTRGMNAPLRPRHIHRVMCASDIGTEVRLNRRESFRLYVESAIRVITEDVDATCASQEQLKIMNEPEKYCPFPINIPSWEIMAKEEGPYRPEHLGTKIGLFSSILAAVTRKSCAIEQYSRVLFANNDDFVGYTKATLDPSKNESEIERSALLAGDIWRAVEQSNWENIASSKPSFEDVFKFLSNSFKQVGPLSALNIAGVCALTGTCLYPTTLEMANSIFVTKAHSNSVRAISYLKGTSEEAIKDRKDIADVLEDVQCDMEGLLAKSDQNAIGGINSVVMEYCLSKFGASYPVKERRR